MHRPEFAPSRDVYNRLCSSNKNRNFYLQQIVLLIGKSKGRHAEKPCKCAARSGRFRN